MGDMLPQGFWEAKDSQDDLLKEVQKKLVRISTDNHVCSSPNEGCFVARRLFGL